MPGSITRLGIAPLSQAGIISIQQIHLKTIQYHFGNH